MVNKRELDALYRQKLELFAMRALSELEPTNQTEYNWHIGCACEHLQAVWENDIRRLIINIVPRALKTHLSSVAFPSWGFGQDPSINFMLTSHKFDLAKSMTRKTRQIMLTDWYRELNPHVQFARDQNAVNHFMTTAHGQYLAGAMESVTGSGADIQLLDDPHNPTEAVSDVQRMNAIDTIRSTLFSRFNDPRTGRFILIMQRLHADDATGNLLKDDGWVHLKIPAEAPANTFIELRGKKWHYDKSGLFFPERFTKDVLEEKKRELGPYAYAGQYLQNPVPLGGGEFKDSFFQYYKVGAFNARGCNVYILVDPNREKKKSSDYTAIAVIALGQDQNYYLVDGVREILDPKERAEKLFELHRKWTNLSGKPPKVGYEHYGAEVDLFYIKEKQRDESYRFHIKEIRGKGAKEDRIRRLIPDMSDLRFYLPEDLFYKSPNGLISNFISDIVEQEFLLFPVSPHDDFMDAMSMIYDMEPVFPKQQEQFESYNNDSVSVLDL